MSSLSPVISKPTLFQGTFTQLQTFWHHRNAAASEGGIACEDLEALVSLVKSQYPDAQIACNPYLFPAQIQTQGPAARAADAFIEKALSKELTGKKVRFEYQA